MRGFAVAVHERKARVPGPMLRADQILNESLDTAHAGSKIFANVKDAHEGGRWRSNKERPSC